MQEVKVAILGVGTVGTSVINNLIKNQKIIQARCGKKITPVIGLVKDINKKRNVNIPLSDDIEEVLNKDDIDIFVELTGGIHDTYEVVKKIIKKKKPLVTANKALLAYYRDELEKADIKIGYEASVAGGIPIIKALREGLSVNNIVSIKGIINGTSNYILSEMMKKDVDFKEVLKKAQDLGYAEANPSFDIDGFDTAHKLLILASIAFGIHAKPEDILIKGIKRVNQDDVYFAKEFNYNIKLLGIAKVKNNEVQLSVYPALIPQNQMLAKVDGVMNAISVIGDVVGEGVFFGAGAGGDATSSAVIADLIDIVRNQELPLHGYKQKLESNLTLMDSSNIKTKYFLRLQVIDKPGVLAKITLVLGEANISIASLLQKLNEDKKTATLLLSTHICDEINIKKAMKILKNMDFVKDKPFMIRIEE